MNDYLIIESKRLSFLLRHDEEYNFDQNGWRELNDLIVNHGFSMEDIEAIVLNNNKQRYELNEERTMIRARQGHSVEVDVELKEQVPPAILYHGTAEQYLESITTIGLIRKNRLHVHLSLSIETATKVGSRHGKVVVLKIDAQQMQADGYKFYLSNNGVWLTSEVPVKYIEITA